MEGDFTGIDNQEPHAQWGLEGGGYSTILYCTVLYLSGGGRRDKGGITNHQTGP
jgi:hypothetical protein